MNFWNFIRSPASVRLVVEFGRRLGLTPAQLLAGTRLTLAQLEHGQIGLSPGQELAVIANLLRLRPAYPGMGLQLGLSYQLSAYGVLGLGMMSSANAVDAMRLAGRFLPLTYTYVPITHRQDDDWDSLLFEPPAALAIELRDFVVERAMGASVRVLCDAMGVKHALTAVRLRGPAASTDVAAELSGRLGCVLQWDAAESSIFAARARLLRPLPQANTGTAAMCERMCDELVERRRTQLDTVTLVREYLAAAPDQHRPKLAEIAALLCTSERTLKRWFCEGGTSFRQLLEDSRYAKADRLLQNPLNSLTEIAVRLGFSDLSSFSQAYKRWTGTTPSQSSVRSSVSSAIRDL